MSCGTSPLPAFHLKTSLLNAALQLVGFISARYARSGWARVEPLALRVVRNAGLAAAAECSRPGVGVEMT